MPLPTGNAVVFGYMWQALADSLDTVSVVGKAARRWLLSLHFVELHCSTSCADAVMFLVCDRPVSA